MELAFDKLRIKDFKEYRGKHVLDISGLGRGVHFMRGINEVDPLGSNGAGKTTIWDAFMWCTTGKTTRGLRGTDVRTWGGDEHAVVSVSFWRDDDGHVIKRSTKTNGLWLDGKLTSQEEIDRLIILTAINIPHTILLGQKRDLFFDLKPEAKLTILSETLDLDKWEARSSRAKDTVKDLEKKQGLVDARVEEMKAGEAATRDILEDNKRKSRAWEQERSSGADKRDAEIAALKKAHTKITNAMGTHDLAYDGAETELRAIRRDILKKADEMPAILDRIVKYKSERDTVQAQLDALDNIEDKCPTCGQEIASQKERKAHAKKERPKIVDALEIAQTRYSKWLKAKNELNLVMERMREDEKGFGKRSDDAKDKYDQHKARIADIDQQIAVLKAKDRADEENPFANSIRDCRELIKKARAAIIEGEDVSAMIHRRTIRTRYWIGGFKQVRLYLLQDVLEELQEVTQNLLPDVGLDGWLVEYDIEREKKDGSVATGLNVRIMKPGMDKAVRWEAWSGGENQRLLIVGALALSEVLLRHAGVECDLIVLDEPTRHMSKEGVNDLVDHLVMMGRDRAVFYCDHAAIESARFANVITITKDEEGSRIDV